MKPNRESQAVFNADPDAVEWLILQRSEDDNLVEDSSDDPELLLLGSRTSIPARNCL